MSHDNNRWLRRIALGLVFASVLVAGRVSPAAATEPIQDPYLADVFVRPGESLGGPDGGPTATRSASSRDGDQIAIENAIDDARARGASSAYPTPPQVWTDRD